MASNRRSPQRLSPKQRLFVAEYIIDWNATKAAIRAGYSDKTARQIAEAMLSQPHVMAAVQEQVTAREARTMVTQDRVLLEIARLAFSDPRKAFDANGDLLPIKQWPDDVAAAISSVEVDVVTDRDGKAIGSVKKVKFWDKGKQLELAGRHLQMFTDKVNVNAVVKSVQLSEEELDAEIRKIERQLSTTA